MFQRLLPELTQTVFKPKIQTVGDRKQGRNTKPQDKYAYFFANVHLKPRLIVTGYQEWPDSGRQHTSFNVRLKLLTGVIARLPPLCPRQTAPACPDCYPIVLIWRSKRRLGMCF
jgi:hypothetical protein